MHALQLALLCQEGLDPTQRDFLLEGHARKEQVLQALPPRLQRKLPALEALLRGEGLGPWEKLLQQVDKGLLGLLRPGDAAYPAALAGMVRPPDPLFYRGRTALAREECVAIVGTRQPDAQGLSQARTFALALREMGCVVVSGGAAGIDGAAHLAAGAACTVAVVGCGFNYSFPSWHRDLFRCIGEEGLLISEWPPWVRPEHYRFPRRNRIIAGLCRAVVVVQAPARSGAINTAHHACEEGREVLVVPGPAGSALYQGSHRLVREGARLMASVEDLREDLGRLPLGRESWLSRDADVSARDEAAEPGGEGFAVSDEDLWRQVELPRSLDELAQVLGTQRLEARVLSGELEGWLLALPGERWVRRSGTGPPLA